MATHLSAIGRASVNLAVLFERGVGFLASLVRSVVPTWFVHTPKTFHAAALSASFLFSCAGNGKALCGHNMGFLAPLVLPWRPCGGDCKPAQLYEWLSQLSRRFLQASGTGS